MNIFERVHYLLRKPKKLRYVGRMKVRDSSFPMAITYRMRGLFPGAVTRSHPQWIEPVKVDPASTALSPGQAVKINATGDAVTALVAGDSVATYIYGVVVRSYPTQPVVVNPDLTQTTATPVVDVMREGYVGVSVSGTPKKDGAAFAGLPAGTAQFAAATGTGFTTASMTNCRFNGPPDSAGVAELVISLHQP